MDQNPAPDQEPAEPATDPTPQAQQPDDPAPAADPEPTPAPDEEPEPVKLTALAEQLGIEPDVLFKAVGRDGISVSEAMDLARDSTGLTKDRETFETERDSFRLQKAQAEQQLADLVALLPQGQVSHRTCRTS